MSNTHDYSTLFYLNPLPHWVYDIDTFEILDVNQATIDLYGYSRQEFLTLSIKDLRPEEEMPKLMEVHKDIHKHEGNKHYGTFTHKKKDGTIIRVETNGHRIEFQGRDCFMVICQDVTDKEKHFRQSKEALHVMDASMDVICSIDEQGRFVSVSRAALDVWGYQPEELVGKPYLDLVYEDDKEKTSQTAVEIMSGKSVTTFQNRYVKNNGEIAYNIWSARWDATTKTMYAIARDAHEKRKIDEVLIESEQRFKALVQEGSDLIAILDVDGNYKYVSPTSLPILGFTPEVFLGKSPFEFIHPEDIEKTMQSLGKIANQNRVAVEPFRFKNKDGEWHWIETVLTNMLDNPSIEGIVANSRDITSQKNEEQRLKLMESVVTYTNDAVLITEAEPQDEPGPKIVYVNEAFTKMTGYTADEVIGKSPRLLQGPKTDKKELLRLGKALRNWEPCEATLINYKKNGEAFWINFSMTPVADEKGWYTHWISVEHDVTAAKNEQLQKELLSEISAVFNEGTTLNSSLEHLCHLIANYGEFNFCEIWLPNLHQKALRLSAYANMDSAAKKFHKHSKRMEEMAFNVGLPGKVWTSKASVIWEDIENNEFFIRNKAAQKAGLKTVLGIPLMHQDDIVGVLVVGSIETNAQINQYQSILAKMETVIGSEINRKRLESELHHLFDTLPDVICVTDEKGRFLKMNKAGYELLGSNEHDVIGNTIETFAHPLDKTIFNLKRKKAKKENQNNFSFQNSYITKKKEILWLNWNCNLIKSEGLIYATAKNITDEKKLQELVTDASKMARIGGWEVDLVSKRVHWSKILYEIHETNPETFVPTPENTVLFFREDYQEKVTNIITEAVNTRSSFDFEAPIITGNKNQLWVRSVGTTEFVEEQCVRIFGSFQDITQRKETELRLKSITDDLPGVAFQYYMYPDGTGKFESVSEASRKIWGISPQDCEKDDAIVWDQIKKGGDYDVLSEEIQQSINTLSQWHGKWRNVMPNGELRWHEGYGTPYKLSNGTILFNTMVFDITDEVKLGNLYDETSRLSKIGSWELDLTNQGNTDGMYWSPVVREIIEVDANYDASLSGGIEFYTEESKVVVKKAIEQLIEKGIDYDLEVLLITKTGKEKWVRIIGKSERINEVCTKIFGSIQDIHVTKSTKLRLQEILGSISDAFLALDEDWNFIYFNKEAENILNKKSSEVIGKRIWDVLPYIKGTELERVYHEVAKTGNPMSFEYLSPKSKSWFEINVYPSIGGVSTALKAFPSLSPSSSFLPCRRRTARETP
ncbi:MAG: PAS domain S-box protein, partial [Flavobacteriales bacterium]